jgi:UDP-N-acetylmuramate--alanine ligase
MKVFSSVKYVYLLGIGGIGMSGLARYFNRMGKKVSGYDRTETKLTQELVEEGIEVHYEDDIDLISTEIKSGKPEERLVIYTPAIPKDHKEYNFLKNSGVELKKRSEVLGQITEGSKTIAIGGTHGKTTTTTLVAHILKTAGFDMAAFLGGISTNYNTNFLLGDKNEFVVVEADEFDRSFLTLHPDIAIITSVDADHLDIYGDKQTVVDSYKEFGNRVKKGGTLLVSEHIADHFNDNAFTYSVGGAADYTSSDVIAFPFASELTYTSKKGKQKFELGIAGLHNVENATAAIAAAELLNIDAAVIRKALKSFQGVKRRFEYHIKNERLVFIDDYAHHPKELSSFISSVKKIFKGKKVTGIFQPHLYSRTRDFSDGFKESLSMLDEVILLDIYPARELPIEGVSSSMLLSGITANDKKLLGKKELMDFISENEFEVLLTMGAGDIDLLVEPIKKLLEEKIR